jgi:hypothetical protein
MSTNAFIGIRENNSITYIYNHSDGYVEYLGRMLLEHYNSEEKAKALVELGDVSVVKEKLAPAEGTVHSFDYDKRQEGVSVFYGRDRGEEWEYIKLGFTCMFFTKNEVIINAIPAFFFISLLLGSYKRSKADFLVFEEMLKNSILKDKDKK